MCIYQRIRTKNYIKYVYCLKRKKEVTYKTCSNCKSKEYKKVKEIKKKSSKLAKLERNRFSILTNDLEHCYICHSKKDDLHEIFSGSNRKTSIKNGFVIPICRKCHTKITNNVDAQKRLQMMTQAQYEAEHSREDFVKIIGKSYL